MSLKRTIYLPKAAAQAFLSCISILVLILTPLTIKPSKAQDFDISQSDEIPNELIFRVILPPQFLISEAIFAYEQQGTYYLPIIELSDEFSFLAETDADFQVISGFAGKEENTYNLDVRRKELTIKGSREQLPDNAILRSDYLATDDLYVSLETLNKMWPINLAIDLPTLTVEASSENEEDLAFVKRKQRKALQEITMARREQRMEKQKLLPRRDNPYSWFGKPVVDIQSTYKYDDDVNELTGENIFTGVQQVGKFLTEFSANYRLNEDGEIDRPDAIRFKASRKSAGDEYLVPNFIRRVEFGDVNIRQRELISNTETGRGFTFSNDNRERSNQFDEITLEGTGPPGWDIEVYNNEELIRVGIVPDNGQFFFEDVVLNYGNNRIKILLFGPQGQVREQIENLSAGGNMLRPGQFTYDAGLLDSERDFILLDNDPRTSPRGYVKSLQSSYGVNRWLTVFGNVTETPNEDKSRKYLTLGGLFNTGFGLIEAEAYNELGGGNAISTGIVTEFKGVRTNLDFNFFNDFESEDSGFGDSRKTFEAELQLNKNVNIADVPLGLRLSTVHTERVAADPQTTVNTSQTFTRGPIRISHNTASRFTDFAHESTTAGFSTTIRQNPWQVRGSLNYEVHPVFEISTFNSELRYDPDEYKYQAAFTAGHNFSNDVFNFGLQGGYDFDALLATAEANFERRRGWEFIMRATTSLSPYTSSGNYGFSSEQQRNMAPLRGKVFLDNDLDGEFGPEDEPLEGVRLAVGNSVSRDATNEDGVVITNGYADRLANVRLDKASLEDPYYVSTNRGFSIVPARGGVVEALFPIIESGSIEGTVYRENTDKFVSGLTLELVDAEGKVINEVISAFDGFYAFEFVPPGTYTIRAEASQGVNLLPNQPTVNADDLFVFGEDLYLESDGTTENFDESEYENDEYLTDVDMPAVPAASVDEVYGPFREGEKQTSTEPFGPFIEDIEAYAGPMENEPIEVKPTVAIAPQTQPQQSSTAPSGGLYSLIK